MRLHSFILALALIASMSLYTACSWSNSSDPNARGPILAVSAASLSGRQETPPTPSGAHGAADFIISGDGSSVTYTVTFSTLAGATSAAHVHVARPGEPGPVVFDIFDASQAVAGRFQGALTAANLASTAGMTFAQAIDAFRRGRMYVNVHSSTYPDGEIRGQIGPQRFTAILDGAHMVPGVATTATGIGTFALDATQTTLAYSISHTGFDAVTDARIGLAPFGANGATAFDLLHIGTTGGTTGTGTTTGTGSGTATGGTTTATGTATGATTGTGTATATGTGTASGSATAGTTATGTGTSGTATGGTATAGTATATGTASGSTTAGTTGTGTGTGTATGGTATAGTATTTGAGTGGTTGTATATGSGSATASTGGTTAGGTSVLLTGSLNASRLLTGAGTDFPGLVDQLLTGGAYVVLGSVANPTGEIRGQIAASDPAFNG